MYIKYFYSFILALTCISTNAQLRFDLNFIFEGRMRNAVAAHPGKPAPIDGYPIVFMLHGTSGNGEEFYEKSAWKELGFKENFITVFPSSLNWCYVDDGVEKRNSRWVNGQVTENPCSGPPQNYIDDTRFLKFLVKLISDTIKINSKMVFVSGFSNGSAQVHKLAIEAGDVFKAGACASSFLPPSDSALPVARIPVWHMLGTRDDRFYTLFNRDELPHNDTILAYFQGSIRRMLVCQGLAQQFTKEDTATVITYKFDQNASGQSSSPYWFSIVKGMTHQYPNGTNYPMSCPEIFWDFFKRSVTTSVKDEISYRFISIFPNPANDYLNIQLDERQEETQLTIYNYTGQILLNQEVKNSDHIRLVIADLQSGSYILKISNDHLNKFCKFQVLK